MKLFTPKGTMFIPKNKIERPKKKKKKKTGKIILSACYCPNGHNLFDESVQFNELPSIKLKVVRGSDQGILALSPVFGDYSRVTIGISLKKGDKLDIRCPHCDTPLPVYSTCYVCDSQMVTLFLTPDANYARCLGICQRVGCHNSKMTENQRILTSVMRDNS
jgi:hypothetical protein